MKKIYSLVLVVALLLSFTSCGVLEKIVDKAIDKALSQQDSVSDKSVTTDIPNQDVEPSPEQDVEPSNETSDTSTTTDVDDNDIRPEFKEAMDSYEEFFNEYCDFMEEYLANPTDLSLLSKYADLTSEMLEVEEAFSAWDQDEMTKAELKYYTEVSARVSQKLLDVTY